MISIRPLFLVLFVSLVGASSLQAEEISLQQAVEEALASNLGLALVKQEEEMAQAGVQAQQGAFDAQLAAGASTRESELTPTLPPAFGGVSEDEQTSWQASLAKRLETGTEFDLSWQNGRSDNDLNMATIKPAYHSSLQLGLKQPLLKGFGQDAQLARQRAAQQQAKAAVYLVDSQAADLVKQVKDAYWQLVYAWQDLQVNKLSLRLAQQLRDETASKIEAGSLAQVEIYQPESEVARREQQLIGAERAIGLADDGLKLLLNRQDWQQALQPVDQPPATMARPDLAAVLAKALAQRPDLQAAKLQVEAARYEQQGASNGLLPSLDLSGGIGISGVDDSYGSALDNLGSSSDTSWQVGLVFSTPLGNNLAKGQHRQARANLRHKQTQAALLRQEVQRQVRQAVRDVELASKAIEAASKTALASQKRLEGEQAKFEVGLATTFDVLAAQQAYAQALAAENLSKVQLASAAAELDRIQGVVSF